MTAGSAVANARFAGQTTFVDTFDLICIGAGPTGLACAIEAKKIGLDSARFDSCFDKGKSEAGIRKDMAEGAALGVTGTPTFFINGRELIGAQPPEKFNEIIDDEIARGKPPVNEAKAN